MRQILEGSRAIALTIKNIKPGVVSAYPITPQTHIVEDLARFKADGETDYEYVRAESEFAAASIVEGASATGIRTYTATSSQGLLLMNEVIYNIAGMRLPVVMTLANRGVSAPITIWNDHQDGMSVRDAGWIMLFSENAQEAVLHHILAYKLAEGLHLPVMVNVDGFVLTHSYEPVTLPSSKEIRKFLPDYKPKAGEYLDPKNPATFGAFAAPPFYMEIRQELHEDMLNADKKIDSEYAGLVRSIPSLAAKNPNPKFQLIDNGLIEYYGPKSPETVLVAMGSMAGTIKDAIDEENKGFKLFGGIGILKIRCFRPFPAEEIRKAVAKAKYIGVIEKALSLGSLGPLMQDIASSLYGSRKKIINFAVGLGGRDVTKQMIKKIMLETKRSPEQKKTVFIGA